MTSVFRRMQLHEQGNMEDTFMEMFLLTLGILRDDSCTFSWNSKCRKHRCSSQLSREAEGQISILRPGSAQPHRVVGPVWFFSYKRLSLRNRLRGNSLDTLVEF